MAWFDPAWDRRRKVTIDKDEIPSNLTDFPVQIRLDDFPDSFWDNVKSDGGDIRVTQSDGATQEPADVVIINTGTKVGQLRFKGSSISSSVDTDFYIYYDNPAATLPAPGSTYGQYNVYDSDEVVDMALEETGDGTADEYKDRTTNQNHGQGGAGDSGKTPNPTTGVLGTAQDFEDDNLDEIDILDDASMGFSSAFTFEAWVYPYEAGGSAADLGDFIMSKTNAFGINGMEFEWGWTDAVKPLVHWYGSAYTFGAANTYPTANQWNYMVAIYDGTDVDYYLDAVADGGYTPSNAPPNTAFPLNIGTIVPRSGSYNMYGKIDNIVAHKTNRTADYMEAKFNNIDSIGTFYTIGDEETENGDEVNAIFFGCNF